MKEKIKLKKIKKMKQYFKKYCQEKYGDITTTNPDGDRENIIRDSGFLKGLEEALKILEE